MGTSDKTEIGSCINLAVILVDTLSSSCYESRVTAWFPILSHPTTNVVENTLVPEPKAADKLDVYVSAVR